ncbi:hypothetical protein GA0115246_105123 [Streptomyces sp. SolWspMP-sol7th]|nr:hypothetical protein GA0115246_105123 [Streptomyces sp. SolWspMP-sol7th]
MTTARRKTIVSEASRIVSAISFGVFCRAAPSTRPIMRSMKVSPGFAVIRTTTRSERTRVPPVTAQRSPPDSRMTGADSPVMADSSTEATPSTTSPSPGMTSPASQTTRSPTRSAPPGTCSSVVPSRRRATVSPRVRRRDAACALPRPSATASARFAKSVVSHSHAAIVQPNHSPGWRQAKTVVRTEPISTTNMTGEETMTRGSSLRSASGRERTSWAGSKRPPATRGGAVRGLRLLRRRLPDGVAVLMRRALRRAVPARAPGSR